MMSYEGVDIALRLNAMGIDAFVLKYRLIHSSGPAAKDVGKLAVDDGRQAMRLVRGIGDRKVQDFGEPVLTLIQEHGEQPEA